MSCSGAAAPETHEKKDSSMTPFGLRVRKLRKSRGITLKKMAADLDISSAYLSALEHGHRGRPSWSLVAQICDYFNIIWDDAEELQRLASLSHPKVTVDTSGLNPLATEYANLLANKIRDLPEYALAEMLHYLKTTQRDHE
jgi:transcriptional regulator with XRE-family HTH domain